MKVIKRLFKRLYDFLRGRLFQSDIQKSILKGVGSGSLNGKDWQSCGCGAKHYVGNQKKGKHMWCPLCGGYLKVKKSGNLKKTDSPNAI